MRMKRSFGLAAALLLAWSASAGAWFFCCNKGIHCIEPPPPPEVDCGNRCDKHHCHCPQWKSAHAHQLLEDLCHGDCCCERIKAAKKLGCRLHADFCCDCDILPGLVTA